MLDSNKDVPIPLYYRLSSMLKEQILEGNLPAGSKLPTEAQLADQHRVSRLTVRRAKAALEEEGLITTIQGSGSRVADVSTWNVRKKPLSVIEDIIRKGEETSFDLHEFHMVANTPEITEHLQNPDDKFIFQICGVRYWSKNPLSYVVYYLPYAFGKRIQLDRLTRKPFLPQFEKMIGCKIVEGIQSIYPNKADREVAEKLNLREESLILSVDCVYINEEQVPVYYIRSSYLPDYKYEIRIQRAGTDDAE